MLEQWLLILKGTHILRTARFLHGDINLKVLMLLNLVSIEIDKHDNMIYLHLCKYFLQIIINHRIAVYLWLDTNSVHICYGLCNVCVM